MKYRCLLVIIMVVAFFGYLVSDSFAHDGKHITRPSPFTECKYTVETVVHRNGVHEHHYRDYDDCWVTDETYVVLGLGAALAIVLAVSLSSRKGYYATEFDSGMSFTTAPTMNIRDQELGLRFNLNW